MCVCVLGFAYVGVDLLGINVWAACVEMDSLWFSMLKKRPIRDEFSSAFQRTISFYSLQLCVLLVLVDVLQMCVCSFDADDIYYCYYFVLVFLEIMWLIATVIDDKKNIFHEIWIQILWHVRLNLNIFYDVWKDSLTMT